MGEALTTLNTSHYADLSIRDLATIKQGPVTTGLPKTEKEQVVYAKIDRVRTVAISEMINARQKKEEATPLHSPLQGRLLLPPHSDLPSQPEPKQTFIDKIVLPLEPPKKPPKPTLATRFYQSVPSLHKVAEVMKKILTVAKHNINTLIGKSGHYTLLQQPPLHSPSFPADAVDNPIYLSVYPMKGRPLPTPPDLPSQPEEPIYMTPDPKILPQSAQQTPHIYAPTPRHEKIDEISPPTTSAPPPPSSPTILLQFLRKWIIPTPTSKESIYELIPSDKREIEGKLAKLLAEELHNNRAFLQYLWDVWDDSYLRTTQYLHPLISPHLQTTSRLHPLLSENPSSSKFHYMNEIVRLKPLVRPTHTEVNGITIQLRSPVKPTEEDNKILLHAFLDYLQKTEEPSVDENLGYYEEETKLPPLSSETLNKIGVGILALQVEYRLF